MRTDRLNTQIERAWDATIGSFVSAVESGYGKEEISDFGYNREKLINLTYGNLMSCYFTGCGAETRSLKNRDLRFCTKAVIMARINEMWDNDFNGDVTAIKPYLAA